MPTPVQWLRGPWATVASPGTVSTTAASPYSQIAPGEPIEGSGWGGPSRGEAPGWGPYGTTLGNLAEAAGRLATGNFVGAAIPGASLISRALGLPSVSNPYAGFFNESELRDIGFMYGNIAETKARADQAAQEAAALNAPASPATNLRGEENAPSPGGTGEGVDTSANAEAGGYAGFGMSGPGGYGEYAKGGVRRTRRPFNMRIGEAGEETGIAIPKAMERPGLQGREEIVLRALLTSLGRLLGRH